MGQVLLLAFSAALNPTLVAASTLMMLLPNPVKLMLGYLLGALVTSITLGLVIVFSLEGSGLVATTRNSLSPAASIALGAIALVAALVLHGERPSPLSAHTRARKSGDKAPPRWQRALNRGSPRVTFVVGALLTLPGASYLAGLNRIDKLNYATGPTVLVVIGFNLIMLALLEVPLVCFVIAPDWTPRAIERARSWVARHARPFAISLLTGVGGLLVVKGVLELLL